MNNYYKALFSNLILSYNITIKKEHQFIYNEFLNHLISDSENLVKKNYQSEKNGDKNDYCRVVFHNQFYTHIKSSEWFNKIYNPDECPEVIKRVRKNKLNQLYGRESQNIFKMLINRTNLIKIMNLMNGRVKDVIDISIIIQD